MSATPKRGMDNEYAAKGYQCKHCLHWERFEDCGALCMVGMCGMSCEREDGHEYACVRFDYGQGWCDEYAKGAKW